MNTVCPFCSKTIVDSTYYESDTCRAIYNIAPILPGHSLVFPKRHVQSVMELEEQEIANLFSFCQRVSSILKRAYGHKAFDWTLQDGEPAGQTVDHLHIHIIPRHFGDLPNPGDWYPRLMGIEEGEVIDSDDRPTLTVSQLSRAVKHLRSQARESDKKQG